MALTPGECDPGGGRVDRAAVPGGGERPDVDPRHGAPRPAGRRQGAGPLLQPVVSPPHIRTPPQPLTEEWTVFVIESQLFGGQTRRPPGP